MRNIDKRTTGRAKGFIKFNKVDKSLGVESSSLSSLWKVAAVGRWQALEILVESILEDMALLIAGVDDGRHLLCIACNMIEMLNQIDVIVKLFRFE